MYTVTSKTRWSLLLTFGLALAGCGPPETRTWDVTAEFSSVNDPSGSFSVGWKTMKESPFNRFDCPWQSGSLPCVIDGWEGCDQSKTGRAGAWRNCGNGPTLYGVVPGQVSLHPGMNGQYVVLRWIAPDALTCTVKTQFFAGDHGDTDVYIVRDGAVVAQAASTEAGFSWQADLSFAKNQPLDFLVGSKGDYTADNTPISVVIACR